MGAGIEEAEEKLRHEKFPSPGAARRELSRRLTGTSHRLRGKVLFNFVWFDVKLASCHFQLVFFCGLEPLLSVLLFQTIFVFVPSYLEVYAYSIVAVPLPFSLVSNLYSTGL